MLPENPFFINLGPPTWKPLFDTQAKPIAAEDHAIALVKYENGAIGQMELSWTFCGGMDLRDEVMGSKGAIWINSFLRTGKFVQIETSNTSGA